MSFASDNYKKMIPVSEYDYSQIVNGCSSHVVCADHAVHVGHVIGIEPASQQSTNDYLRQQGAKRGIECEYAIVTSEQTVTMQGVKVRLLGFKRLNDIPQPVERLIDSLYRENQIMRRALMDNDISPNVVIFQAKGAA